MAAKATLRMKKGKRGGYTPESIQAALDKLRDDKVVFGQLQTWAREHGINAQSLRNWIMDDRYRTTAKVRALTGQPASSAPGSRRKIADRVTTIETDAVDFSDIEGDSLVIAGGRNRDLGPEWLGPAIRGHSVGAMISPATTLAFPWMKEDAHVFVRIVKPNSPNPWLLICEHTREAVDCEPLRLRNKGYSARPGTLAISSKELGQRLTKYARRSFVLQPVKDEPKMCVAKLSKT